MKITLTGSLGHISRPLAVELIGKGHTVTVVSSKAERQKEIEALGARAAIGTLQDAAFLAGSFAGADIVYCMEPPSGNAFRDPNFDNQALRNSIDSVGNNFKYAIGQSGVKRVIHLSSVGAHTDKGNGLLFLHYRMEQILQSLPSDVAIKFMRPTGFYYNLLGFMDLIRGKGFMGALLALRFYGLGGMLGGKRGVILANHGGDKKGPWVSPLDIAAVIAEEMESPFEGRMIRYIASEEISCNEIAKILGWAIGKPFLKWGVISDRQMQSAMVRMGANPEIAHGFVEMYANSDLVLEDYYRHRPATLGKVKMKDYAVEFAKVYRG
jgi:uncharacterized protein YbjT (DUF2867 family)